MLKIFNTLTRQKEEFKPLTPNEVKMYVCGPTVYNYIHIGNARSIVAFDTVRRYLEFLGYKVKFVSNFTDVDDKMIKEANREGITVPEVADRFIKAFYEDIAAINVQKATINPRATDNIQEIIDFVKALIDKGYAYESDGDVFYRARKFQHYGELSDQNIDQLVEGASEHIGETEFDKKQDPIDFVLWKKAKPNEIKWDSPWGEGRPGWHIECSVMSTKYLGDTFDIHGGGQDLEFPHHENEIAQSEAKTGQKFVNYWMHNGFVTVENNEKMSKSLGNFVTVHDLVQKTNPQVLRFFLSSTHYRRPLEYSEKNLQKAADNLEKIKTAYNNLKFRLDGATDETDDIQAKVEQIVADFKAAMNDDFNVQNGLTEIFNLVSLANNYSAQDEVAKTSVELILKTLTELTSILGIKLDEQKDLSKEIQEMVDQRDQARADKDFATSDKLRDRLKEMGVILEDTPQGTRCILMTDVKQFNGVTLAYLGDAVYEVFIREHLLGKNITKVNELQKQAKHYVSAKAQASLITLMMDKGILSDEEIRIYKNGRNAKKYTKAKNTSVVTYHMSTGFEALFGYLDITGNKDRVVELAQWCINEVEVGEADDRKFE